MKNPNPPANSFDSEHFAVSLKNGYVYESVKGKVAATEAQEAADVAMELARCHNCRRLMVDVTELEWISDVSLRNRGIEIVGTARKLFDKSAIITPKAATRYLVVGLMRGGGLPNVKGFSTKEAAKKWLLS